MIDETAFERDLRAMLAAQDPGPASPDLAIRIRLERTAQATAWRRLPLRVVSSGTAAIAIGAAVVFVAALMARTSFIAPGAAASTPPLVGPAAVPVGAGVAGQVGAPTLQILLLAIVMLSLASVAWRAPRKWVAVAAALAAVALAIGAVVFALAEPLGRRDGASGAQPVAVSADGRSLVVLGGGDFWVETTLTNVSALPLTIRGLNPRTVPDAGSGSPVPVPAGFVGIGLIEGTFGPEGAIPFHPVELAPDASVEVVLHGLAGECALPSIPPEGGPGISFTSIELQVEQLGVLRTVSMPLDQPIGIYQGPGCP
jgi:hypothetical protein